MKYYLCKKEDDDKYSFDSEEDGQNIDDVLKEVNNFKQIIENDIKLEIFEIKGRQFMTEQGVFIICREDELEKLGK